MKRWIGSLGLAAFFGFLAAAAKAAVDNPRDAASWAAGLRWDPDHPERLFKPFDSGWLEQRWVCFDEAWHRKCWYTSGSTREAARVMVVCKDDTWAAVDIGKAKERLGFFNTRDDAFAAADAYISRLP